MNLDNAISAHAEWKMKLRSAIAAQSQLDAATISKDNCCPLGQWLHGEARAKYGHLEGFRRCLEAHANFHREAGRVAQLINQKKFSEAEAAIGLNTHYAVASSEAGAAIIHLKRESGL